MSLQRTPKSRLDSQVLCAWSGLAVRDVPAVQSRRPVHFASICQRRSPFLSSTFKCKSKDSYLQLPNSYAQSYCGDAAQATSLSAVEDPYAYLRVPTSELPPTGQVPSMSGVL